MDAHLNDTEQPLDSTEARLNKLEAAVAWKRQLEMGTILFFGTLNVVVKLLG